MNSNKRKEAKYFIYGGSNVNGGGSAILNPKIVSREPFRISDGFSVLSVGKEDGGIDRKGERGNENALLYHGAHDMFSECGKVTFATKSIITHERYSIQDMEDMSLYHVLIFDSRKNTPLVYVRENRGEDNKLISSSLGKMEDNGSVTIVPPSASVENLHHLLYFIIVAMNNNKLNISKDFLLELKNKNLLNIPKYDIEKGCSFVSVFDKYFVPSLKNIQTLKEAISFLPDDINIPRFDIFSKGLSSEYTSISLEGITLKNKDTIPEKLKVARNSLEIREKGLTLDKTVIGDITVGIDSTGAITIIENYAFPFRGGGDIAEKEIKPQMKKISSLSSIFGRAISKKISNESMRPSLETLLMSEAEIKDEFHKKISLSFDEESTVALLSEINGVGRIIFKDKDSVEAKALYGKLKDLEYLSRISLNKSYISKQNDSGHNLLVEDGSRLRGMSFSSTLGKPTSVLASWGVDRVRDLMKINFSAKIPILSTVIGGSRQGLVNFEEKVVPAFSVWVNGRDGEVRAITYSNPLSTIYNSVNEFEDIKLGRVLAQLLTVSEDESSLSLVVSSLLNDGMTRRDDDQNKVSTGFGIGNILNSPNEVSSSFRDYLQRLRSIMYPNSKFDVSKLGVLQDEIMKLKEHKLRSHRALWASVESNILHDEYNYLLYKGTFVAKNITNSRILVSLLNDENSLSGDYEGLNKFSKDTINDLSLLIKKGVGDIFKVLGDNRNKNLVRNSKDLASNIELSREGDVFSWKSKAKIEKPKWLPEIYTPQYSGIRAIVPKEELLYISSLHNNEYFLSLHSEKDGGSPSDERSEVKQAEAEISLDLSSLSRKKDVPSMEILVASENMGSYVENSFRGKKVVVSLEEIGEVPLVNVFQHNSSKKKKPASKRQGV